MTDLISRRALLAIVVAAASGVSQAADTGAQTTPPADADAKPVVDPAALEALGAMTNHLRSLKHWSINARIAKDKVIGGRGKLNFDHQLKARFVNGTGLFMETSSAARALQYYYDRKQFTLYSPRKGYYATVDAPDTVGATLDAVSDQYGVELPLSDLFYWGTEKLPTDAIEGAIVVGAGRVNGQDCTHYAYRQADVDWQLCITGGEQSLPLKLVITTTDLVQQPAYMAWIDWDLDADAAAGGFTFEAPEGAAKISFAPLGDDQ